MTGNDLDPANPIGIDGVEFLELATAKPQALGPLLESLGFSAVARHRSRAVTLYRQGTMNLVVNAHGLETSENIDPPRLSAIAFRVRNALHALKRSLDHGASAAPIQTSAMELNIPAICGAGGTFIYFVDRYQDFSIYDVDFIRLEGVDAGPAVLADAHYFGVVQTILQGGTRQWVEFYRDLFGFSLLPNDQFPGILPKGTLLTSPRRLFYLQLLEPPPGAEDVEWDERLLRIALGVPDVLGAVEQLSARGVAFSDFAPVRPSAKGALTQFYLGGLTFELVASSGEQAR